MRDWLRQSLLNSFSLDLTAALYSGLTVPASLGPLFWAGIVLTLLQLVARPVIKLILLPLNLLTLGLLSWLSQVLVLVIAVNLLPQLRVTAVSLPAFSRAGFAVPGLNLNLVLSFVVASLLLSLVYHWLDWALCRD